MTRKRNRNEIETGEPVFFFMREKIFGKSTANLIPWNAAQILKRFHDGAKMKLRAGFVKEKNKRRGF
jgi:hypothetical protein